MSSQSAFHYNPLDTRNLAENIADVLLKRPTEPLPPSSSFPGTGIYAIYYTGDFPPYQPLINANHKDFIIPIYVGKAVPKGGRTGAVVLGAPPGNVLFDRLSQHAESISQSENLKIEHFRCRYLTLEAVWIPLGESLLIQRYSPLWNSVIKGFGNHDPGGGRYNQKCSAWDALHPGRSWALRCQPFDQTEAELAAKVERYFERRR